VGDGEKGTGEPVGGGGGDRGLVREAVEPGDVLVWVWRKEVMRTPKEPGQVRRMIRMRRIKMGVGIITKRAGSPTYVGAARGDPRPTGVNYNNN
jgi:hypothetical protein